MKATTSAALGGVFRATRRRAGFLIPIVLALVSIVSAGSPEQSLQTAAGPFAVAGTPGSFSVAWVQDAEGIPTLWLRVVRGPGSSALHLVAGNVEREAGIFLDNSRTSLVVAWKNAGEWKIGHLDLRDENGGTIRSHPLLVAGSLRGISLREDGTGLMALTLDEPGGLSQLVEIDLTDGSTRTLHQFDESIVASAMRTVADRVAVAWTDPEGGLTLRILDESGRILASRKLNVFPVAGPGPRIGRFEGMTTVAWVERLPDGFSASVGAISEDGTLTILHTDEIGQGARAGRIVPSRGDGRLVVLEGAGQPSVTSLWMLDGRPDTACGPAIEHPRPSAGSWLLGGAQNALLFQSRETDDGRFSLNALPLRCGSEPPTADRLDAGTSPVAGGAETDGDGGATLGGSADPCDGWDDDGDGILDNGCDSVCDAPEVALGPLDLVDQAWQSSAPVVVRAGSEYGVAFTDSRGANPSIFFVRMDESGNAIDERRITADTYLARKPTLVWTGSQYGLAWEDFSTGRFEVFVAILNSDGSISTSPRRVSDDCTGCTGIGGWEPSIGWRGGEYGVVFSSDRTGSYEIFYARLQPTGVKIGTDIAIGSGSNARTPSLAWAGTEWGVAWKRLTSGNDEIYFRRLHALGTPIGSVTRVTTDTALSGEPSLTWSGAEYGLAWHDTRSGGYEIYFTRLDSMGSKLTTDIRITTSSGSALYPSLVWTGGEYAVSWHDTRGGNQDVYTARISPAGVKQGGDLRVSAPPAVAGLTSLAWSGTGQVVVWEDNDDGVWGVHTAFVRCCDDADGDGYTECGGDPNDQDAGSYPGGPDPCDGRDNNGDGTVDEFCDGICTGPDNRGGDLRVSDAGAGVYSAAIAWNGSEFGVAWGQTTGGTNLWFRRLDADGQPIGPATSITAGNSVHALVWNGTEYGLLANDSAGSILVRLDATGNFIGTTTFDPMDEPAMVWNGSEYAIVTDEFLFYRIDAAGNQIGQPVDLGISAVFPYPDLAWNGAGYGLAYDRGWLYFQRFDTSGTLIGGETPVASDGTQPSLVWTGSEYGLAWNYANGINDNGIRFVRLDANGVIQGTETTVTSAVGNSQAPLLRWTGEEYGVAWQDDQHGLDWIFFRRLTAAGANNGSILQAMDPASTDAREPSMIWNGTDYGIVSRYIHTSSTSYETWFQRVQCCGQSADGDGWGKCDDCDDQNPDVYPFAPQICDGLNNDCYDPAWPALDGTNEVDLDGDAQSECAGDCDETDATVYTGAPELCDFQDNDCDTVVDEGFPIPGPSDFLSFEGDKQTFEWAVAEFADRYDVVRGELERLHASGGDFAETIDTCLRDDLTVTGTRDPAVPPVGNGFHYLVRAQAACKDGSYDSGGMGQVEKRDAEIAASPASCP